MNAKTPNDSPISPELAKRLANYISLALGEKSKPAHKILKDGRIIRLG